MNKLRLISFFVLIFLSLIFIKAQDTIEAIVAIVNDDVITLSDYKSEQELLYQSLQSQIQGEELENQYKSMRKDLLDKMVTELLLSQEAEKKGINVNEQLKMMIENIKTENNIGSDQELIQAFTQQGVDFEVWKEENSKMLLRQGVVYSEVGSSIVIDDSEIVNYYKQHPEQYTEPVEYTLQAVYISSEGKIGEEIQGKKDEIQGKLDAGEDFSIVAGEYSEGPEKDSNGDLGSFKRGELAKSLEQAVEGLKAGKLTPWIETPNGWYILKLKDRKESHLKAFDECRGEIEEKLFGERNQQKLQEYLQKLKKRSYIKILISDPIDFKSQIIG